MMRWIRKLKIFKKLMLLVVLSSLITTALGALALMRLKDMNTVVSVMDQNWLPGLRLMLDIKATLAEYRISEVQLVNRDDDTVVPDYLKRLKEFRDRIDADQASHARLVRSLKEAELSKSVMSSLADYLTLSDRIIAQTMGRDRSAAVTLLNGESKKLRRAAADAIDSDAQFTIASADDSAATVSRQYFATNLILAVSTLCGCLFSAGLGVGLARTIVHPIRRAAVCADAIARGELDVEIVSESGDEAGALLDSMAMMQKQLKAFISALGEMAEQHDLGKISFRASPVHFPGVYGGMVSQVNDLVDGHVRLNVQVVEVMESYARGDFQASLDRLPGEKARISDSMAAVRASLKSINAEILKLVDAATLGDFSARGDEKAFSNDFARMVAGLNCLMQISDRGLNEVVRVLVAIADGDLSQKMPGEYSGAFARVKTGADATIDQLHHIVCELKAVSGNVNLAASEILSGNAELSARTEAQAASLEETASSMEELTSTVRQNADHARQANQLAIGTSKLAAKGGQAVLEVVETMSSISESAHKIVEIVGVIDSIAFQTNILALNAAVEAARAGEEGRGFAVVAAEVRILAQRSATAAKDIKRLIDHSVSRVESGARLVNLAGETMKEIVSAVTRQTNLMAEITSASIEQTAGIEQVNQTIIQMDQATQQNAAMVEQATASAQSLEEQARLLVRTVAAFNSSGVRPSGSAAQSAVPTRSVNRRAGVGA